MSGRDIKHGIFILASLFSVVMVWIYGIQWMLDGGNILNFYSFFADAFNSGSAAAFLTIDILTCWGVYMIWVVADARRIGMGTGKGVLFLLLSLPGTCFAFPLYLVARERFLDARNGATEGSFATA